MNVNTRMPLIRNIDIALLRTFVAVIESGSMTVASNKLNLTQGAISQQIKRLENFLQKPLLRRKGGGLTATCDGERLALHAHRMIALNDEVIGLMTAPEFTGVVRLGMPYDIVSPFAAPILQRFASAHPNVRLELALDATNELKKSLSRGDIDLTLTTESHTPKEAERLFSNDLVWVSGAAGNAHNKVPLPVVICNEDCQFRPIMLNALKKAGRDWKLTDATRNMDATFAMLEADLGVATLLESSVPANITILGEDSGLPRLPEFFINLYMADDFKNDATKELAQNIRDLFSIWRRPQSIRDH